MTTLDIIISIIVIILAFACAFYAIRLKLEPIYHELLVSAIFRYRTQCYMTGIEPGFDLDIIGRLPWWSWSWKHMVPEEASIELRNYMLDLKDDDRFYR